MAMLEGWQKALIAAGVGVGTAGLLWYLLREGEDEEEASSSVPKVEPGNSVWKVSDKNSCAIGIRAGPDTNSAKSGQVVPHGSVFEVSEMVEDGAGQCYLKLADGRGWAFTHSPKDGRLLAEPATEEEFQESEAMMASMSSMGGMGGMEPNEMQMMALQQMQQQLQANPDMMRQMMADPQFMAMMQDPEALKQIIANSPAAQQVMGAQPPGVREQLESEQLGASLSALG